MNSLNENPGITGQPAPSAEYVQSLRTLNSPKDSVSREFAKLVFEAASAFHEAWRTEWQQREGNTSATPRWKATGDAAWAAKCAEQPYLRAGTAEQIEVNINISFDKLPQDWQKDNLEAAELAAQTALRAARENWLGDPAYAQRAGALIHEAWCERRRQKEVDSPEFKKLDVPFGQLESWRQEQDMVQARIMRSILSPDAQTSQLH